MQIVIEIPEEIYKNIREYYEKSDVVEATYSYIYHGTPLPKGHGRLIDADDVNNHIIGYVYLNSCPTIIEADKGDKE